MLVVSISGCIRLDRFSLGFIQVFLQLSPFQQTVISDNEKEDKRTRLASSTVG